MWDQEKQHLSKFNEILAENRVRPTLLLPLWNIAGFALGKCDLYSTVFHFCIYCIYILYTYNDGLVSYKHAALHWSRVDNLWIIVMLLSAFWTLILMAHIHSKFTSKTESIGEQVM